MKKIDRFSIYQRPILIDKELEDKRLKFEKDNKERLKYMRSWELDKHGDFELYMKKFDEK